MEQMSYSSTRGCTWTEEIQRMVDGTSRTAAIYGKIVEKLESTWYRLQCEECQTKLSTLHSIFVNIFFANLNAKTP